MKEKLQTIVYKVMAIFVILLTIVILCAMLAGPLMIGWNLSFGLIATPVTYIKCLKIIIGFVLSLALIGTTLNKLSNRGR